MLPATPIILLDVDKKIVNINETHLKKYLEDLLKQKHDLGLQIADLTLDKPFRSKAFPLIQSILLNPLKEWTSTTAPRFKADEGNYSKLSTWLIILKKKIYFKLYISIIYCYSMVMFENTTMTELGGNIQTK